MFVGVGAARIRDLFAQAIEKAPCILFIDELDALGKVRVASPIAGHDEREQTLNQLLAEMDGFETKKGVIILAATNRPEILDSALLRPGRFDRQVLVDRPDIRGREAIFKVHTREVKIVPDLDLRTLAARTPGFVGADIRNAVNEAALLAARKGKDAVGLDDLEEAIERVVAGLEKKKRVISDREREILAYHESGHAIVGEKLVGSDPVHKISIVQRGIAALGYTMQLPTEDRYILTRAELLDRLASLLGGRAAEEVALGVTSTGAHNDLQRVTEMARSMVTELGMSTLGPVAYGRERKPLFIEGPSMSSKEYSEQTAREIDEEVRRLVEEGYERAVEILQGHRDALDRLAELLLEREVLRREEFLEVLEDAGPEEETPAVAD
jgi:cell division protease FtsH